MVDDRRTGSLRPTSGPSYMGKRPRNTGGGGASGEKHKRKPPRGMYINHDDIVALASNPNTNSDDLLSSMDREVVALMSQVSTDRLDTDIWGFRRGRIRRVGEDQDELDTNGFGEQGIPRGHT